MDRRSLQPLRSSPFQSWSVPPESHATQGKAGITDGPIGSSGLG